MLPPVVVKQEFTKRPSPNNNNNNIPSHLDVPKKLPSAKKSPPPEIKMENNGIKMEGESSHFLMAKTATLVESDWDFTRFRKFNFRRENSNYYGHFMT